MRELRKIPGVWAEKIQQVALRGTPDILACCNGVFVAIELKVDDNKADPLQEYKLEMIRGAGGKVFVAYPKNAARILSEIRKLKQEKL